MERRIKTQLADNQRLISLTQSRPTKLSRGEQQAANAAALARDGRPEIPEEENSAVAPRELQPGLKPVSALSYEGQSAPVQSILDIGLSITATSID